MRNRKGQKKGKFLLGLLVGVVALGIGYAAISNVQLFINGTAKAVGSAQDSDFVVKFVETTDSESPVEAVATASANPTSYSTEAAGVTATTSVIDATHATFSVDGMVTDDEVTFTYYIANLSNGLGAKITPDVSNDNEDIFEVTVTPGELFNLASGNLRQVTVNVKCIAQNKLDSEGSFEISFDAAATEE